MKLLLRRPIVLDLTDEKALLCGKILAQLGADVIKVEPPGGDRSRLFPPFYHDIQDPNRSLYWWAFNTDKRSITMDLKSAEGRDVFLRMAKTADFVLESFEPGYLDSLGLGYSSLAGINPRLIVTSITPFGQTGPYKHHKASDIVLMGMSGAMMATGDMDRAPLTLPLDQAYYMASSFGAMGAMIAHQYRETSGEGQHVDVSIYECTVRMNYFEVARWQGMKQLIQRSSSRLSRGKITNRILWPCIDGYVTLTMYGGVTGERENRALTEWMDEEGKAGHLKTIDWAAFDMSKVSQEELETIYEKPIYDFFTTHTKEALTRGAALRGIRICPLSKLEEVLTNEHLQARNFFVPLKHSELQDTITYPGHFFVCNETENIVTQPAPLIGEHNQEVFESIGLRTEEAAILSVQDPATKRKLPGRALKGLKVLEFGWVLAGPWVNKYLADFGAQVIKVENPEHPDVLRLSEPYKDNIAGLDRSYYFIQVNTSKYSIALDLTNPKAKRVIRDLVCWADIVVENFRPGVMKRLGLGYEDLKQIKPDIIMASLSSLGSDIDAPGFGNISWAWSGQYYLTGWPDREPAWPSFTFVDVIQPTVAVTAIIAALDYRRRTGKGQHIDVSQLEVVINFMAPALLDCVANQRYPNRIGNRSIHSAPHGAFRCMGQDKWCTIAVSTDQQWDSLCRAIGNPALAKEPRFASLASRKANEDELESLIEAWTINRSGEEVVSLLQKVGVPSGVVQIAADVVDKDPQLKARRSFVRLHHPVMGIFDHPSPPLILSRTPARMRTAPCIGEHNEYVMTHILGLSTMEFIELLQSGVIKS